MPYLRPGSKIYQIRVHGVRQSSGVSDEAAATALEEKLNRAEQAAPPAGGRRAYSWAELVIQWHRERSGKASFLNDVLKLKWLDAYLGAVTDISTIKRSTIAGIIESNRPVKLSDACPANSTANRFVSLVQAMLNLASDELEWIDGAPKLKKYSEPDPPMIALTLERWRLLEKQLPPHLLAPALFSIATGLRAEKVFKCEWSWIDFDERTLTFKGRGNKLGNTIPLNDTAMNILLAIKNAPLRHIKRVFVYKRDVKPGSTKVPTLQPLNDYGRAFYKAMERAGFGELKRWTDDAGVDRSEWCGDFHWHGFRKTFATWLRRQKVPNFAIDELCGWSTGATRDIYIGRDVDHLREYTHRIDEYLAGKVYKSAEQRSA